MNAYVLDTSVAAAWYLEEAFSAAAREWQERLMAGDIRLFTPPLHYLEFANVLRALMVRDRLPAALASEIYQLHLETPIESSDPDRALLLTTALEYGASAYDAAFISLALVLGAPLITAERTTTPWVAKLGKRVVVVR